MSRNVAFAYMLIFLVHLQLFVICSAPACENVDWIKRTDHSIEILSRTASKGTLIYLHGALGDSPMLTLLRFWVMYGWLRAEDVKIILPKAPLQQHSASGGFPWKIWFDRDNRDITTPEKEQQVDMQAERLSNIVRREINQGTGVHNIVIGGFSLGGAMALHLCLRYFPSVAGCSVEGSYLSNDSAVYRHLRHHPLARRPPVLMQNGLQDRITTLANAVHTYRQLSRLNTNIKLVVHKKQGHVPNRRSSHNVLRFASSAISAAQM